MVVAFVLFFLFFLFGNCLIGVSNFFSVAFGRRGAALEEPVELPSPSRSEPVEPPLPGETPEWVRPPLPQPSERVATPNKK